MSSDEDDYMSEKFLCAAAKVDVRPGLLYNHAQKRQHEMIKKKLESQKRFRPMKEVEADRREEGLSQALDSSNKGFALLQKMGYKPGSAIGKTGEGRIDPIGIAIKADRGGLGREAALKEVAVRKAQLWEQMKKLREQLTDIDSYRSRMAQQQETKLDEIDLQKSQRVCQQLDTDKNIEAPSELWFWPEVKTEDENEDEEENEFGEEEEEEEQEQEQEQQKQQQQEEEPAFEAAQKLEILTLYLRKAHDYCIWCGTKYEDQEDLLSNCPGSTRNDH